MDVKIVRDWETDKIRKLLSSPSFYMAGIHMRKTKLVLNKPVYTGMMILENSKILMYDFFYNYLKAGFVRVLENLESPGILLWHFPGLESPGKRPLVLDSSGNL